MFEEPYDTPKTESTENATQPRGSPPEHISPVGRISGIAHKSRPPIPVRRTPVPLALALRVWTCDFFQMDSIDRLRLPFPSQRNVAASVNGGPTAWREPDENGLLVFGIVNCVDRCKHFKRTIGASHGSHGAKGAGGKGTVVGFDMEKNLVNVAVTLPNGHSTTINASQQHLANGAWQKIKRLATSFPTSAQPATQQSGPIMVKTRLGDEGQLISYDLDTDSVNLDFAGRHGRPIPVGQLDSKSWRNVQRELARQLVAKPSTAPTSNDKP